MYSQITSYIVSITDFVPKTVSESSVFGYSGPNFTKKAKTTTEKQPGFAIQIIPFSHKVTSFNDLFKEQSILLNEKTVCTEEAVVAIAEQYGHVLLSKKADATFIPVIEDDGSYAVCCIFFSVTSTSSSMGITKISTQRGPYFKGFHPHAFVVRM